MYSGKWLYVATGLYPGNPGTGYRSNPEKLFHWRQIGVRIDITTGSVYPLVGNIESSAYVRFPQIPLRGYSGP